MLTRSATTEAVVRAVATGSDPKPQAGRATKGMTFVMTGPCAALGRGSQPPTCAYPPNGRLGRRRLLVEAKWAGAELWCRSPGRSQTASLLQGLTSARGYRRY